MTNMELPISFVKLVFEFENIFTKPNFKYFLKVISGLILGKPKKTITSIIRVHKFYNKFYNFHRFLNKLPISKRKKRQILEICRLSA